MDILNLINIILFIIIIIIVFVIKYIYTNNLIVEKYNTENNNTQTNNTENNNTQNNNTENNNTQNNIPIVAKYINTNGATPIIHNSPDMNKKVRSPTLNEFSSSTATFRPCQIHFNTDGTSKYIYEDEWQEFDTLVSGEDSSEYKVPYKKFSNDKNNVVEFENFNESTKCFKLKNNVNNLNTYKYKSNDLIKYKPDSFVAIKYKKFEKVVTDNFMQMNFNKHSNETSLQKYKEDALDSICSYNYNRDLSLGAITLYRLTITYPETNNENQETSSGIITAIDHVKIKETDNSTFIVDNPEITNIFPELLSGEKAPYYSIENGKIIFRIDKKEEASDGINVEIYKFNRNLNCPDDVIKSYEISNALRLHSHLMIKADNYISSPINPQDPFPYYDPLSNEEILKLFNDNSLSKNIINREIPNDIFNTALKIKIKDIYDTKDELLIDIKYFICKLIIISNKDLVTEVVNLINKYDKLEQEKKEFIDSFNTIQKFIKLYNGEYTTILDKGRIDLLEDIKGKKKIKFNEINIGIFPEVQLIAGFEFPYTLDYVNNNQEYDILIFTSNGTITIAQDTICDILIVAGGGAGGSTAGGGGGAGGLIYLQNQNLYAGSYNIIVGRGGNSSSENGYNSSFNNIIAIGGGGGSTMDGIAGNGGSGGGGSRIYAANGPTYQPGLAGGLGTSGQGTSGGHGKNQHGYNSAGGGGGGAGRGGKSAYETGRGGDGGIGISNNITGTNIYYAGGGGGGSGSDFWSSGAGGQGGGGNGAIWANTGSNGIDGLGGGGGGGSSAHGLGAGGGKGGSGVVIIRKRKITITNNKGDLVISNTNYNKIPIKIIMKNNDLEVTINNYNVALYKNKTYEVDYDSNKTRIREQTEPARIDDIRDPDTITLEKEADTYEIKNILSEKDFEYTSPGSYTFKVPTGVTNICILCVGGGGGGNLSTNDGGGGGGGGLRWVNNLNVTPNQDFNIIVGYGGSPGKSGATSMFYNSEIRIEATYGISSGNTSTGGAGGSYKLSYSKNIDAGGGNGGDGGIGSAGYRGNKYAGGGGGAGGYSGRGGRGGHGNSDNAQGENGQGGGGGGGGRGNSRGGGGGGIGLYGIGSGDGIGIANTDHENSPGGGGGSGGSSGNGINGGVYGGGGGGGDDITGGWGGNGAVRIMCTISRSFPSKAKKQIVDEYKDMNILIKGTKMIEKITPGIMKKVPIPAVYKDIAIVPGNNIRITYLVQDENYTNYINARDNQHSGVKLQFQRIKSENNQNIYKIATKNQIQQYLKVNIVIRNVINPNEQIPRFEFWTHKDGGTRLNENQDYPDFQIIRSYVKAHNDAGDIFVSALIILFLKKFSGDIFMKLSQSPFIYDYTEVHKIDIESDYINGRDTSLSLQTIISTHESAINNYFGINNKDSEMLKLYNNRTFFTQDTIYKITIQGSPNNKEGNMLTKLQNIYNSLITFNSQDSSRKLMISFLNNVKVSDCIPNFNRNSHITYENPKEKHAINYDTTYNIQKISKNYLYFRYSS
jgi:hypothetical protein